MNINKKTIKSSIQSIGNSLIVYGLIVSLFKDEASLEEASLVMFISIIIGIVLVFYSSLEQK